ncbi:transglycosylase SLT domain-containing protein [Pectinatus haikarae]|uniref:transglycosylase SLT domain-containing protein n=1 Tax=Pectinatus haikarae TaxID=349096 RepID=UPI0018C54E0E|nr:transglycosylase SLT domain-containing protein [Pectinatus haikarae]
MAQNDVQINIIGKDNATGAFQSVLSSAEKTSRSIQGLGGNVGSLNSTFSNAGTSIMSLNSILSNTTSYALAIAGVNGLGDAMHSTIGAALEFYTTMQTGAVSLAGSLMSMGQINGESLTWNQSLSMSKELMQELSDQALVTGASTREISDVFRAMLPNALNAGMSIEQTLKLAGTLTTTGKSLGLNGNILMRDAQDLISGKNVQRTKLGAVLGLTNEDIQQAKQSANGLFNFLSTRLQGEMEANQNYLELLEGRWNHLKEAMARIGGLGATPLLKSVTDELANIANQFVKINNQTREVEYVNPDIIEEIASAGQVLMNFGNQFQKFVTDISGVGVPALHALGAGIDFVSQHAAIMGEVLMVTWVGRGINSYILDYRNVLNGATEAETFLGRAALKTKTQLQAQTAAMTAQKTAYLKEAQTSMATIAATSAPKVSKTNIAAEIALEAQLGQVVTNTTGAETRKMLAATTAATAFRGANAALLAGENELAIKILETNTSLDAQGVAAGTMSARAASAIELIQMGETELAQKILETNAAFDWQGTAAATAGVKAVEGATAGTAAQATLTGEAAKTATVVAGAGTTAEVTGGKMVTAGRTATTIVKDLASSVFTLAGGWVTVALMTMYATSKLDDYFQKEQKYTREHTFQAPNGQYYTYQQNGNITPAANSEGLPSYGIDSYSSKLFGQFGIGTSSSNSIDNYNDEDIREQEAAKEQADYDAEIQKEVDEEKSQQDRWLAIQEKLSQDPHYLDTQKAIKDLMGQVTGKYSGDDNDKSAQKAARQLAHQEQQIAEANKQYSDTINKNAQLIKQANDKMNSILASLDEKLLEYTGTQLQIDLSKNKKEWTDIVKQIHGAAVNLKTLSYTTAQHTTMGGGLGADLYNIAASKDGMPYQLGGDGVSYTDCGKLFVDGIEQATGVSIGRTVDAIEQYASDNGAWHPAGDGYMPNVGDGVVVLGGDHIVISNGEGGYVGANSSTGVVEKNSVEGDFGAPVGYVSVSQLFPEYNAQSDISQSQAAIPQTDAVGTITEAAKELGFDNIPLLIALAMRESGGDDVNNINEDAYNPNSDARGMFQITPGQDVANNDGSRSNISDLYPAYDTDPLENAKAAITILQDKINQYGDIWEGVKHYGEGTDEYEGQVQADYNSLGAGINLAPTSFSRYTSPLTNKALTEAEQDRSEADKKAYRDWSIRRRKQIEDTLYTNDQLSTDPAARIHAIRDKEQFDVNAANDQFEDMVKASGKNKGDTDIAQADLAAKIKKIHEDANAQVREEYSTEHDEIKQHLSDMSYLQNDYESNLDIRQQKELERYIKVLNEELNQTDISYKDRLALTKELVEKQQELAENKGKYSTNDAWKSTMREMKSYQMDAQSIMKSGWNSVTGDIEGVFSDLLTTNKSFSERMKNLYIDVGNTILNTMTKIIMQGLVMNSIMTIFGSNTGSYSGPSSAYDIAFSKMQSLLTDSTSSGAGYTFGSAYTFRNVSAYASGGEMDSGYALVGENGAELIHTNTPGYVYNARETADILNRTANNNNNASGTPSVQMTLVNKTGQQIKTTSGNVKFDGKKYVVSAVLEAVANNDSNIRNIFKGMVG